MSEPEDEDIESNEFTKRVNLSLAHPQLTRWAAPPRSEADKDKILKSLFVSRAEYEQYAIDLRERDEREKEAEAKETARRARLENDPKYWKGKYENMVEREKRREEERKTNRQMWFGLVIVVCGWFAASFILKILFGIG